MAGDLVAGADLDKFWSLVAADLLCLGAPGMKAASGGGIEGRWHCSFERTLFNAAVRIRDWADGKGERGVRVYRKFELDAGTGEMIKSGPYNCDRKNRGHLTSLLISLEK